MDFGNILDQWDRQPIRSQGQKEGDSREEPLPNTAKSRASEPDEGDQQREIHPLTAWLRVHGVYDKDAEVQEQGDSGGERRRRLLHKKADAIIDLHGLTREEAWNALEVFFQNSRGQGFEKLLLIHGKGDHSAGEAVLKGMVKKFIEHCPFAGESGHGNRVSGGTGATWVLLKGTERPMQNLGSYSEDP